MRRSRSQPGTCARHLPGPQLRRAVLYVRVSTDTQAREGESIPAQRARLTDWARENGYVVVGEYVDAGESARVADRPEFARMLQDARTSPRPFDAVLVWKWDRFARNAEDAAIYKSLLRRQLGVELIAIGDPQSSGAVGVLLERILDVIAEFQSLVTAEHVKNTMTYLAQDGKWLGKVPFGYRLDETGKLAENEAEALAVRWAFEEVSARRMTVYTVAEEFARGLRFPSTVARGYKWSPTAVRQMLRNPVYTGQAVWNRRYMTVDSSSGLSKKNRGFRDPTEWVIVEDAHPALISKQLFQRTQRVLDEIGAKFARTPNGDYLFRGLVICGRCGHHLSYSNPDRGPNPRLVCTQYYRIPSVACRPMNYIRPRELEEIVLRAMEELVESTGALPELEIAVKKESAAPEPAALLENVRHRLQRLIDAYEAGALTLEEFRERRAALDQERARLEQQVTQPEEGTVNQEEAIMALRERIRNVLPVLRDPDRSVTEKNVVLAEVIDQIVVNRIDDGVRIIWRSLQE